jgi:hypothetical protein
MNNDLEKFDPSKLMQGVKDIIKSTFVGLIPDEQWETMVKKEIDAFFEPTKVTYSTKTNQYFGSSDKTLNGEIMESPFRRIIWDYCSEETFKILKTKIDKDYFQNKWSPDGEELHENMRKIFEEAAPVAMVRFFQNMMQVNIYNMKNEIMNNRY